MLTEQQHLKQVEHNLSILRQINRSIGWSNDWQITVCFYTALHIISAYLSKRGVTYTSHQDTFDALNPANPLNINAIPMNIYTQYKYLSDQSRLARYLTVGAGSAPIVLNDNHLKKAIESLDVIMKYFADNESFGFSISKIGIPILKKPLNFFVN